MKLQGNSAVLSIEPKYGSKASNFLGLLVKAKFERNHNVIIRLSHYVKFNN